MIKKLKTGDKVTKKADDCTKEILKCKDDSILKMTNKLNE